MRVRMCILIRLLLLLHKTYWKNPGGFSITPVVVVVVV